MRGCAKLSTFLAITALRCSAFFQPWAEGLRKRGKSKMSVICAVMRKLIHLAYGVLKTEKPFDPDGQNLLDNQHSI
jgi:transposase